MEMRDNKSVDIGSCSLIPYTGISFARDEFNQYKPNSVGYCAGTDLSGKVAYRYNSLGYRGEEFNPNADFHIFVFGASEGFGCGVDENRVWCNQFRRRMARHLNIRPDAINLLNFSMNGGSTDYITRSLVSQLNLFKPDVVLVGLGNRRRAELFPEQGVFQQKGGTVSINPHLRHLLTSRSNSPKLGKMSGTEKSRLLQYMLSYYSFVSDELSVIEHLKYLTLIVSYLKNRSLPFCIWQMHRYDVLKDLKKLNLPVAQKMSLGFDDSNILTMLFEPNHERAADGIHLGPRLNEKVGDAVWEHIAKLEAFA